MKRFLEWIQVKMKLHANSYQPPNISEGEIWWASLGENIGSEINGNGKFFTRPVIILKKFSRTTYFVVPASSQIHTGKWYVPYKDGNIDVVACLHQARCIDYKRIRGKISEMLPQDFMRIRKGFQELYNPVSYLKEDSI